MLPLRISLWRIDYPRKIEARALFLSFEPLLEDLCRDYEDEKKSKINLDGIHWAIIGGESDYKDSRVIKKGLVYSLMANGRVYSAKVCFKECGI
ncbi:MAG: DUF5131 family protein [Nitrososphaerales archaeon]